MNDAVAGLRWWVDHHLPEDSAERLGLLAALAVVEAADAAVEDVVVVSDDLALLSDLRTALDILEEVAG